MSTGGKRKNETVFVWDPNFHPVERIDWESVYASLAQHPGRWARFYTNHKNMPLEYAGGTFQKIQREGCFYARFLSKEQAAKRGKDITWEDNFVPEEHVDWKSVAALLKKKPGKWASFDVGYSSRRSLYGLRIHKDERGFFEISQITVDGDLKCFARYVLYK